MCLEICQVWFLLQWNYSTRALCISANFDSFLLRSQHNEYTLKSNKKQYEILFYCSSLSDLALQSEVSLNGSTWCLLAKHGLSCLTVARLSGCWRKFLFSVLRLLLLSIHFILLIMPFHSNINKIAVYGFIHVKNVFLS